MPIRCARPTISLRPPACLDPGNLNGDNAVTIEDLFDFLAAWFAGCN